MLKRRLKIITDIHCDVLLDNIKIGTVRPNKLTIFNVNKGEYLLTLVAVNNNSYCHEEVICIEYDKVFQISFKDKLRENHSWINPKDIAVKRINSVNTFIDQSVNLDIASVEHDIVEYYQYGLAVIKDSYDKLGVIDYWGNIILPCKYNNIFCEHNFLVIEDNDKFSILGSYTKTLSLAYDKIQNFEIEYAKGEITTCLLVKSNNHYGLFNIDGEIMIPCEYASIKVCAEEYPNTWYNKYRVELRSDSGRIDILAPSWNRFEKWFRFQKGDKYGAVFSEGLGSTRIIYDDIYDIDLVLFSSTMQGGISGGATSLFRCNNSLVVQHSNKVGVVYQNGEEIIPCEYDEIRGNYKSSGYYVKKNSRWGYLDDNGIEIIPCVYDYILRFVKENDRCCSDWITLVKQDGLWYKYENRYTLSLWPYSHCGDLICNRACVANKNGFGYIDESCKEVIPCQFTKASDFADTVALVKKDNTFYCINTDGQKLPNNNGFFILEDRFTEIDKSERIKI